MLDKCTNCQCSFIEGTVLKRIVNSALVVLTTEE